MFVDSTTASAPAVASRAATRTVDYHYIETYQEDGKTIQGFDVDLVDAQVRPTDVRELMSIASVSMRSTGTRLNTATEATAPFEPIATRGTMR